VSRRSKGQKEEKEAAIEEGAETSQAEHVMLQKELKHPDYDEESSEEELDVDEPKEGTCEILQLRVPPPHNTEGLGNDAMDEQDDLLPPHSSVKEVKGTKGQKEEKEAAIKEGAETS
jgi:hypothetical protein